MAEKKTNSDRRPMAIGDRDTAISRLMWFLWEGKNHVIQVLGIKNFHSMIKSCYTRFYMPKKVILWKIMLDEGFSYGRLKKLPIGLIAWLRISLRRSDSANTLDRSVVVELLPRLGVPARLPLPPVVPAPDLKRYIYRYIYRNSIKFLYYVVCVSF